MALKFEEYADKIKRWRDAGNTHSQMAKKIGQGCNTGNISSIIKKHFPGKIEHKKPGRVAATIRRATRDSREGRKDGETSAGSAGSGESKDGLAWLISQFGGEEDQELEETMRLFVAAEFEGISEETIQKRLKLGCAPSLLKEGYDDLYNKCRANHVRRVSEQYKLSMFHVHEQLAGLALRATEESRRLIEDPDVADVVKRAATKDIYDLTVKNTPVSNNSQKTVDLGKEFQEATELAKRIVEKKEIGDVLGEPN